MVEVVPTFVHLVLERQAHLATVRPEVSRVELVRLVTKNRTQPVVVLELAARVKPQ
jgi:hypothetical protein